MMEDIERVLDGLSIMFYVCNSKVYVGICMRLYW